jgi:hypothetical protein
MQRAPETGARGLGVAIEAWAERAAQERPAAPDKAFDATASGSSEARRAVMAPAEPEYGTPAPLPRPLPDDVTLPREAFASAPAAPIAATVTPVPSTAAPSLAADPVAPADRPARPAAPPAPAPPPVLPDVTLAPQVETTFDTRTLPQPVQPDAEADRLAVRARGAAVPRDTPARNSAWKRRLVAWSIAGGVAAGLAAGGLWWYAANRGDGALVAASTAPARGGQVLTAGAPAAAPPDAAPEVGNAALIPSAPPATEVRPPVPAPSAAVADAAKPVPAAPPPVAAQAVTPAPAPAPQQAKAVHTRIAEAGSTVERPPVANVATGRTTGRVDVSPPKRTPRHATSARKQTAAKPRPAPAPGPRAAAPTASTPSPRERREETLMQCRARGYDERQCTLRACMMTRYGLVCRG